MRRHAWAGRFWLQLPKLEEGFKVLEGQLVDHTPSKDGPLSVAYLLEHAGACVVVGHNHAMERCQPPHQ